MSDHPIEAWRADGIAFVDLRFTDLRGKWVHLAHAVETLTPADLERGLAISGAAGGWRDHQDSDLRVRPADLTGGFRDPFAEFPTLCLTGEVAEPLDPRATLRRAEAALVASGFADQVLVGPELEFYLFDGISFAAGAEEGFFRIDNPEASLSSARTPEGGNAGHRPFRNNHLAVAPVDSQADLRSAISLELIALGLEPLQHHHESGAGHAEIGLRHGAPLAMADRVQRFKYGVHNTAGRRGKTATFMPKPSPARPGNGFHLHLSLHRSGDPVFAGDGYAGLSAKALQFIAGVLHHARALSAFCNPSTSSFRRLLHNTLHPWPLGYGHRNRTTPIRIPQADGPEATRLELRFPDPAANPYLAIAAVLLAGLDGMRRQLEPGSPCPGNGHYPTMTGQAAFPRTLHEAIDALAADYDFLTAGGAFTPELLTLYAKLKRDEALVVEQMPNPAEFQLYYSC